ncbi:MAG: ABC transporter substrate-binding protein [Candidatus Accumulibacter sp.]|nr:ABC transporter substrate-binding protein [Accumulibacter sp.]
MSRLGNLAAGFFVFSAFLLPAAPASAADTGKLIFGQTPPGGSLQSAHIAIALEKNLFRDVGLEVEIVRFPSGRRGLEAIVGGQIDLAYMAEYPPAIAALQKQDFAVITQLGKFVGNRVIGRGDLGFASLKDIAGKKIGTSVGTNAEFFTQLTLEKTGAQAEIVNINPPDIIAALDRGDIQVAIPFPDYYDKAREALGSRYREVISKDYESYNVVSASGKILRERPGDVRKFLAALIKADDIIRNDPADAKATILAASQGALNAAVIDKLWPEYRYALGFDDAFLDLVAAEAKWLESRGIIKGASIDRAGLRAYIADGPIGSLSPRLNRLSK